MIHAFQKEWLRRFGLGAASWRREIKAHLAKLTFSHPREITALLRALFVDVPRLIEKQRDLETKKLADAFGWCCFSLWQCGSSFPAFPENYALFLLRELRKPPGKRIAGARLLSGMIAEGDTGNGRCGFNSLTLAAPDLIRKSERLVKRGRYDVYLRAQDKYSEYVHYLKHSKAFREEWKSIKRDFPSETHTREVIHRTLIPERNWERGPGALFDTRFQSFQSIFDLFCWKYFLWGMEDDKPLLMKSSAVFTPFGTQIFIPGYLSLDGKRDLNIALIARLHRARGIPRQGFGFSNNRKDRMWRIKQASKFDREARKRELRGNNRYSFIRSAMRLPPQTDPRTIRSWLQQAKQPK